jgi:hypothetical protein
MKRQTRFVSLLQIDISFFNREEKWFRKDLEEQDGKAGYPHVIACIGRGHGPSRVIQNPNLVDDLTIGSFSTKGRIVQMCEIEKVFKNGHHELVGEKVLSLD